VLSQRLRELEGAGVVRRAKLPPPAAARVYELTDWGRELEPVILALGRWGSRGPFPDTDVPLGADALMIALKTLFDPTRASGTDIVIGLKLGEHDFRACVADGRLELVRDRDEHPDATIEAEPASLAAVLWHGRRVEKSAIAVTGDARAVKRFLGLFPPPRPAGEAR
jgi:hypothetical protein